MDSQSLKKTMLDYQSGDQRAFERIFHHYRKKIYGYLRKRIENRQQCEDVMQMSFMKIHTSRHSYDPQYEVDAWIFVITRSCLFDFLRVQKRQLKTDQDVLPSGQSDLARDVDPPEISLDVLSDREKLVLEKRFKEDLNFDEIAKSLALTESNVRKILSRSLQRLRLFLRNNHERH